MDYGLIGERLSHSFSKTIHDKIGSYGYALCPIQRSELDGFMKSADFKGINVTIPYKQDVIKYLDEIDDTAKKIGSVNTIKKGNGRLIGYNTDYAGFSFMARRAGISFSGKKVVILGSGGTSLTARAVAKDEGAGGIVVVSRGGEDNYSNISRHSDADIIINTTPLGMYPGNGESPVSLSGFEKCSGVIDVIYNPLYTKLLLDAMEMKIPCTNGLPMLVAQAVFAHDIFFDARSEDGIIEKILGEMERETKNIVLIGMPGSGKSSIGKAVADRLGREFIDTDSYIEEQQNTTIPNLFESFGEQGFRSIESSVAEIVGKTGGRVIATGGGIILKNENYRSLRQNGTIFFLHRDLENLEMVGRPLSKSVDALRKLFDERIELYKKYADFTVFNNNDVDSAVAEILQNCYKG